MWETWNQYQFYDTNLIDIHNVLWTSLCNGLYITGSIRKLKKVPRAGPAMKIEAFEGLQGNNKEDPGVVTTSDQEIVRTPT